MPELALFLAGFLSGLLAAFLRLPRKRKDSEINSPRKPVGRQYGSFPSEKGGPIKYPSPEKLARMRDPELEAQDRRMREYL